MHPAGRIPLFFALWLAAAVLCAAVPAGAQEPYLFAASPVLPGAEEILLAVEAEAVSLRINVFSGEECITSGAAWEDPLVRVSLSRPLEEGESIRILADGTGRDGLPFALDRTIAVSRAGALLEAMEKPAHLSQTMERIAGEGDPELIPGFFPLKEYILLAPEAALDKTEGTVRLSDAPCPREVLIRDRDGRIYGCTHLPETDKWLAGDVIGRRALDAEEILLLFRLPMEHGSMDVTYTYTAREQPEVKEIILEIPLSGDGQGTLTLILQPLGDRWQWRSIVVDNEPSAFLSGTLELNGGRPNDP